MSLNKSILKIVTFMDFPKVVGFINATTPMENGN